MSEGGKKDAYSRRGFLGVGSAALATAGMLSAEAAAQEQKPYPATTDRSASAPGPGNPPLDDQNPDSLFAAAERRGRGADIQVSVRNLSQTDARRGMVA